MNYQKVVCWGDSQTVGARTYGCYPLYLVETLNATTRYRWSVVNLSANGHTARDLWFRIGREVGVLRDCYRACILIGVNDVAEGTPVDLFALYYGQLLEMLQVWGMRIVHCADIPPILADGHAFFPHDCLARRESYNDALHEAVAASPIATRVALDSLTAECFVDPVHLSEAGNREVARCFADSIRGS